MLSLHVCYDNGQPSGHNQECLMLQPTAAGDQHSQCRPAGDAKIRTDDEIARYQHEDVVDSRSDERTATHMRPAQCLQPGAGGAQFVESCEVSRVPRDRASHIDDANHPGNPSIPLLGDTNSCSSRKSLASFLSSICSRATVAGLSRTD
jgi:hypothetical protein